MKLTRLLPGLALVLSFSAGAARAEVTWVATGTISAVSDTGAGSGLVVGDPFHAVFTYDETLPDSSPGDVQVGTYTQVPPTGALGLRFEAQGVTISSNPAVAFSIGVLNNAGGTPKDSFGLTAVGFTFAGLTADAAQAQVLLDDATASAFSSDALPSELVLAAFSLRAVDFSAVTGATTTLTGRGTITSLFRGPVAHPQSPYTRKNVALPLTLTGTISSGGTKSFEVVTCPAHGVLSVASVPVNCAALPVALAGAALTFTPDTGFTGDDAFTFVTHDGVVDSPPATVDLHVGVDLVVTATVGNGPGSLTAALAVARPGDRILLPASAIEVTSPITLDDAGLALVGQAGTQLDGTGVSGSGLIVTAPDVIVSDVEISGFGGYGIEAAATAPRLTLTNVEASGNTAGGVLIDGATGVLMSGGAASDNSGTGLTILGPGSACGVSDGTYTGVVIDGNGGRGVSIVGASPSLTQCTITSNAAFGLEVLVDFGASAAIETASDDCVARPTLGGPGLNNTLAGNCTLGTSGCAELFALDTIPSNAATLATDNSLGPGVAERLVIAWYAAAEVLADGAIATDGAATLYSVNVPAYQVTLGAPTPCAVTPPGGALVSTTLSGSGGVCGDATRWTVVRERAITSTGAALSYQPMRTSAAGAAAFTFGEATPVTRLGLPTGIVTSGLRRYQVVDACAAGYYGATCALNCPGFDELSASTTCGGHGACNDGVNGTGSCTCAAGWYVDTSRTTSGTAVCAFTACGDGVAVNNIPTNDARYEECDDNNAVDADACPSGALGRCRSASCGDGILRTDIVNPNDTRYEQCDAGLLNANTPNSCRTTCRLPYCGDNIEDSGETCDDGNFENGDNCPTKQDNPNRCKRATCGDGFINIVGPNDLNPAYRGAIEGCDDGDHDNHDNCPDGAGGTCQLAACGDGFQNLLPSSFEECDDFDPAHPATPMDGDGCTTQCHVEPGFTCSGFSSTDCALTCGATFSFATGPGGWIASSAGAATWQHGVTSVGATGWETGRNADLPVGAHSATLWRVVAVPPLTDARATSLTVDYQLDVDPAAGNCLEVHVASSPTAPLGPTTLVRSACTPGVGTTAPYLFPPSAAGTNRVIALRLTATLTTTARFGAVVQGVRLVSDADGDDDLDFMSLSCGDDCVDADGDTYCDATSRVLSTPVDCNDAEPTVHPGATEDCAGGLDEDCDGAVDAADSSCVEDCADGVDNGGNGLVDCADPVCDGTASGVTGPDPFCAVGCMRHYSFASGPSFATAPTGEPSIWAHSPGQWATSGLAPVAARQFGRLQFTAALGGAAQAGPAPVLELTYRHQGYADGNPDIFAVCINRPDCQGPDVGLYNDSVFLVANTATPGSEPAVFTLPLTAFRDQPSIQVTLLFDTLSEAQPYSRAGVTLTDVRLFSNIDNDALFEGSFGTLACDPCWDQDGDFYGAAGSPDLTECSAYGPNPQSPIADCNDAIFSVTPANSTEGNCGDGLDNDCDGKPDALDDDCGSEDCANGVDDNGDGNADCADPTCAGAYACNPCAVGFDFNKGVEASPTTTGASAGWTSTGRRGATTAATVLQWGASTTHPTPLGGERGWETRLNGLVSAVSNTERVRGWLTKTVVVPATMPVPELEIVYHLAGDGTSDTFGVCFNVTATACSMTNPANVVWHTTRATAGTGAPTAIVNNVYNDGYFDHAVVPIPKNAVDIVIFYDTQDAAANANPGVFIADVTVRSDIDRDRAGCPGGDPTCGAENFGQSCDVCIDRDDDGRGDPSVTVSDLSVCPVPDVIDCNDSDPAAYPQASERCYFRHASLSPLPAGVVDESDQDCDGWTDRVDTDCFDCGNGQIETKLVAQPGCVGACFETCDDGNDLPGDGCSAACQVEAGQLYLTELHLPVLFGSSAEQWIELYNGSAAELDLSVLELTLRNNSGGSATFAEAAATCFANTRLSIPPDDYFIIAFGDPAAADFASSALVDAFCPGFSLNAGGDKLTIERKGNTAADRLLDAVDYRSWSCALGAMLTPAASGLNIGRSFVLRNAESSNAGVNDQMSSWCLAGPGETYSATTRNVGSPHDPGACAEFSCDGKDDDCDGTTDDVTADPATSELPNADGDTVCDARDCDPSLALCNSVAGSPACVADADGDQLIDCKDQCNDADGDGYGTDGLAATPGNRCAGTEPSICEGLGHELENPGNVEFNATTGSAAGCTNGLDDNCDQARDCRDAGCSGQGVCAGEVCSRAESLTCGVTKRDIVPVSNDFVACADGVAQTGNDLVYSFTATFTGPIHLDLTNNGTRLYMIQRAIGSCVDGPNTCTAFTANAQSSCVNGGRLDLNVTQGTTYYFAVKQVGTCSQGVGVTANLTLSCPEVCSGGVDEDADGRIDCADADCVVPTGCLATDFDADGVPNGKEWTCGTNPLVGGESPTMDGFLDTDADTLLNCVDPDDDNDRASDALELARCANATSKNDPTRHPSGDLCGGQPASCLLPGAVVCGQVLVDGDCNGEFDSTQAECGVRESDCGDSVDNDSDGKVDCRTGTTVPPDEDCVADPFCYTFDFDGDGADNQTEAYCNTNPLMTADVPSPPQVMEDPDHDGLPNCFDEDDDGDNFPDSEEIICGSNPVASASKPSNCGDTDAQCDAVDLDDDDDGFPDVNEITCLSDPCAKTSTPRDATHDVDQDATCNALDADDDGDGWFDFEEAECETAPLDGLDNPTANNEDLDSDHRCDKIDPDDDNDTWLDAAEVSCGTNPRDPLSFPSDADGDGTSDAVDADDDGDGVDDNTELLCQTDPHDPGSKPLQLDALDTDGDGTANCVDADDDDDGITDALEAQLGTDAYVKDSDEDGLDDGVEDANKDGVVDAAETSPLKKDTDGDGLGDKLEHDSCYPLAAGGCGPTLGWVQDTDGDGLFDGFEDQDRDGVVDPGETHPLVADTDGDTFSDGVERGCVTDPLDGDKVPQDKDKSGVCDGAEADTDKDGIADGVEAYCQTDPFDPNETPPLEELEDTDGDEELDCRDLDDDGDDVTDADERVCGTAVLDPTETPTLDDIGDYDVDGLLNCTDGDDDNDGLTDAEEVLAQTDRKDRDSDDDGLSDGQEVHMSRTSPIDPDSDDDGVIDGVEFGITTATADTLASKWLADADPSTTTDTKNPDTDGDGLKDGEEDLNGNGRVDRDESETDPNDPTDGLLDTDGDGLIDREEIQLWNTDPNNKDSDGDFLDDKLEVSVHRTDPNDPDTDGGGIVDGFEIDNATDPNDGADDFATADISGTNVFACSGGASTGAWLALALALAFLALRRRSIG